MKKKLLVICISAILGLASCDFGLEESGSQLEPISPDVSESEVISEDLSSEEEISSVIEESSEISESEIETSSEPAHVHVGAHHDAVGATCTTSGNVEYWSCDCGKFFSDENCTNEILSYVVDAFGHATATKVDGQAATCLADGYQDAWMCTDCEKYF